MMQDGRIAVYNGTFTPYLSTYDPTLNTWQHMTFAGWSTGNNPRFGGIASVGPYVFVSDANAAAGNAEGVVRFDTRDASAVRFEVSAGTHDVNLGLDGRLYALGNGGDPASMVKVFDPVTLALINTVTLSSPAGANGIAVNAIGNLFVSNASGSIQVYNPTGQLLGQTDTAVTMRDIDLAPDGRLITSTSVNGVLLFPPTLTSFSSFSTPMDPYVSFGFHIPEPSTLALLGGGILISLLRPTAGCKQRRQLS